MRNLMLSVLLALTIPLSSAYTDAIPWENNLEYPHAKSAVNVSYLNNYDIDRNGIVFIKDGHFWTKQGRINFFGTNLTFDACFPEKDLAEKFAVQLAGLGVNLVRIHHIDNRHIWGKNVQEFTDFDPVQLDKLDYLIFRLKQKGIYIDLNLHVSWQYTNDKKDVLYGLIHNEEAFKYGKGLDIFLPELIAKEKRYMQTLLNHRNKYTGLTYKDDPVMALVEINNENSFYRNMFVRGGLDLIPNSYHSILDRRFQEFLTEKYQDLNKLRKAWTIVNREEPKAIPGILPFDGQNNWRVQISDAQKGTIVFENGQTLIHLNYLAKNKFFQFYRTNLSFKKDQDYTIVVEISGKNGAKFRINAMRQGPPYGNAGLDKTLKITESARQTFTIPFKATQDLDNQGRITFSDFDNDADFVVHSVRIYQGKYIIDPLQNITRISALSLPTLVNYPAYPSNYQADLVAFLRKIEFNYWSEMIRYLKKEIGVTAPITGTQIDYSSPELAEIYDYVDIHAYWQHPSFPGKQWDGKNYYVRNMSMVSEKKTNFDKIALSRIKGKPFTISEYNHPYPNLHTTETPTMLAVVSKLQDYDGICLFNFLNNLNLDPVSYFSHYTKFACKAMYPAAALIFRDPGIPPLPDELVLDLGENEVFEELKQFKSSVNPYLNELAARPEESFDLFKTKRIALHLTDEGKSDFSKLNFADPQQNAVFNWENSGDDYQRKFFKYDTEKAKVYIGWNNSERYDFKNVALKSIDRKNRYFQFSIVNLNGLIGQKGRYIVTLTGREFYTNVDYYNYETKEKLDPAQENYQTKIMAIPTAKQNVELIENFSANLSLKLLKPYQSIAVYAVNSKGDREKSIPFEVKGNELLINLERKDNTVVYGIEISNGEL